MMLIGGIRMDVTRTITLAREELRFYESEGYLVVPQFVREESIEALRGETMQVMQECLGLSEADLGQAKGAADKLRQCAQYLERSGLDALINGAGTLDLAGQLLQGDAHLYLPFTAVKAAGGGGQFHMHQDNSYTQHEPAVGSLNIWVALVDMTPENGCLLVVPRSHRTGQLDSHNAGDGDNHQEVDFDPDLVFPVRMRAGDAVAFTRWTVHGSGRNTTATPRVAYALQYHRSDVKYLDRNDKEWKLLIDKQRWQTDPVKELTRENR